VPARALKAYPHLAPSNTISLSPAASPRARTSHGGFGASHGGGGRSVGSGYSGAGSAKSSGSNTM